MRKCIELRLAIAVWLIALGNFGPGAGGAAAATSRLGNTFAIGALGAVRYSDVAYDPTNDVYLTTSGQGNVVGRFVQGDGTPLGGAFLIPTTGAYTMVSRASYSADLGGFLVTWLDTRVDPNTAQIWGRLVKFSAGGAPNFTGADFFIGAQPGGVRSETAAAVSYSTASQEWLVVWQQWLQGLNDIHAQRVGFDGQLRGGDLGLSFDRHWQDLPAVSYDRTTNSWFVVWQNFTEPAGPAALRGRQVFAGTGVLGNVVELAVSVDVRIPDVANQSGSNRHLVTWMAGGVHYARFVGPDGTPLTGPNALVSNSGSYDAFDVSRNDSSGMFVAVYHSNGGEDNAIGIDGNGNPEAPFGLTVTGSNGNFYPKVASHGTRAEWLAVAATQFGNSQILQGQRIVTTSSGGGCGTNCNPPPPPPPPPVTIDLTSQTVVQNGSWIFGEGVAGSFQNGINTYYLISNENAQDVQVRAYFSNDQGIAKEWVGTLAANRRITLDLKQLAGNGSYGAVFQSLTPGLQINVERSIYWGTPWEGSTSEVAQYQGGLEWHFAEGSRKGELFQNFFLLFNPNQTPANVYGTYYTENGGPPIVVTYRVNPQSRLTIWVNQDLPQLAGLDFSAAFRSDINVVAERAMYWGSPNWIGGHASFGAPGRSPGWNFAEGASAPGFETYYLIQNPHNQPITVTAEYFTEFYGTITKTYTVPANARRTYLLQVELANVNGGNVGGVGARFTSDPNTPFIAERSIYWHGPGVFPWVEGTNVMGSTRPALKWVLPEGTLYPDFDYYVLLMNPSTDTSCATLTLMREDGKRYSTGPICVAPQSRKTLDMRLDLFAPGSSDATETNGQSFATIVQVQSGRGYPAIFVEHALYYKRDGANYWRAGSASFGIPQ